MALFLLVGHTTLTTISGYLGGYEITLLLHFGISYTLGWVVEFFMKSMRVVISWSRSTHFCK